MKLSTNAVIATIKLTHYLLVWKAKNDKSAWLAKAGYTIDNWPQLEHDLRDQILSLEATYIETNRYGIIYQINGYLAGPNHVTLRVQTVWMIEFETNLTKFITMYPEREYK